jgi:hypothetical protein
MSRYALRARKDYENTDYHGRKRLVAKEGCYFDKHGGMVFDLDRAHTYLHAKDVAKGLEKSPIPYEIVEITQAITNVMPMKDKHDKTR